MAFKLITVLCAILAFANAGLLTQTAYSAPAYSSAPAVSQVYSSIGSVHQPAVIAHASPAIAAVKTYAAAPVLSAPIAKIAYSPANEVSHVYSSIAAPQHAYIAHADQPAYVAHAAQPAYVTHAAQPAYVAHAAQPASYYATQAKILTPAIGSSQQSTIRSLGGTISSYSKAVDTALSSVRKSDTRVSNNVYTPALATKTIAYQQPAYIEQKSIPASIVSHVTFDGIGAHYAW